MSAMCRPILIFDLEYIAFIFNFSISVGPSSSLEVDGLRPRTVITDVINPWVVDQVEWWTKLPWISTTIESEVIAWGHAIHRQGNAIKTLKGFLISKGGLIPPEAHRHYCASEKPENQGHMQISAIDISKLKNNNGPGLVGGKWSANIGAPIL